MGPLPARRLALLLGLAVLAPALAGCASEAPGAKEEPLTQGGAGTTTGAGGSPADPVVPTVKPKTTSERWHFHDHWKGNPTILLVDANVTFNATVGGNGLPALSALVALPNGLIVPPETGYLTLNVSWDAGGAPGGGLVNVTYRPADSNDFFGAGDLANGNATYLRTTESNCDVPHRQQSAWLFNLTARPAAEPAPGAPPATVRFTVHATIGRPLFIDPPHLDWWQGGDVLTLVAGHAADVATAATPAGNLTLPGAGAPAAATPGDATQGVRVPVDEGRIVPEGTKSVVVMLNWTSTAAPAKLALQYRELNLPSEGPMDLAVDGESSRVFVLPVRAPQTDTTYSNRTTWEFHVVPEGEPAAQFHGSFTLVAWATRLAPADAMKAVGASG